LGEAFNVRRRERLVWFYFLPGCAWQEVEGPVDLLPAAGLGPGVRSEAAWPLIDRQVRGKSMMIEAKSWGVSHCSRWFGRHRAMLAISPGGDDETAREGAAAGRRARTGACVDGGLPIGGGEDHVQSGNFKLGTWPCPEESGLDEGTQAR